MAITPLVSSPLHRADGSALYTSPSTTYSVLAAVNGPLEVQRRDEIPDAAFLEITLRPATGVGGPRERWMESVLHAALKDLVLVHVLPRSVVQVTLQVVAEPEGVLGGGRGERSREADAACLAAAFNAAVVGVVEAGVPVGRVGVAVVVGVRGESVVVEPGWGVCESLHVLAFDQFGELLLVQSVGAFDADGWERVAEMAKDACLGALGEDTGSGKAWFRQALLDRTEKANAWKEST